MKTPTITPFLWFDSNAEEAVDFYISVFKNSKKGTVAYYGEEGPGAAGSVMIVGFTLDGQDFTALNGGPVFKFNESVSFVVHCRDQEEVDNYWKKLTGDGGQEVECGWLKDKFGLSWQIVPEEFLEMMNDPDQSKKSRMMKAMMTMKKLDLRVLKEAFEG